MHTDNLLQNSVQCKVIGIEHEGPIRVCGFPPFLQKNKIHVWSAAYGDLDRHYMVLSSVISQKERQNASTFRNSMDARKYILRHGVLRIILGYYADMDPEMLSLLIQKNGKPELDPQSGYADITFNMSHTGEMVLIGVSRKYQIGVDIVNLDPCYRFPDIAEYILTPAENSFIQRIEPFLRYQAFFRIWAIKEAILKIKSGNLTMMKNIDTYEIIQNVFSSPYFPIERLHKDPPFFIWEFNSGQEYHCVIAAELGNPTEFKEEEIVA